MAKSPLKDQNLWKLWAVLAANTVFLFAVISANAIAIEGLRAAITDPRQLASVGLAFVIVTVINGLLRPETKARLVFLRWRHALPGHRAFSELASADPRVDPAALERQHGGPLPRDPGEQNRVWYRMYKSVENDLAVLQAHRDFLLLRDYAGMAVLLLAVFGAAGFYAIASLKIAFTYFAILALQFAVVRRAAANRGIRTVTTVMAVKVASPARARAGKSDSGRAKSRSAG